ncbi:MAG: hypothetical protein GT598_15605 [Bacteroidales bacterium]|nr:hypothetical protein [Bacteroidales bacterium]
MAMPASGNIAILDNTLQTCSSISCAVTGNNTPPKCLTALGAAAGFTAPYKMSDFYGYGAVVYKSVSFSNIASTCPNNDELIECTCSYLAYSTAMSSGDCYCPTFCWCLSRGGTTTRNGTMVARICCNGSIKCTCCVICGAAVNCSGTWSFLVKYNDTVCVLTCAVRHLTDTTALPVRASICLSSLISTSGSFCVGSPSYQLSQTCVPVT